ncbi:MAG: hypothetical protein WC777_04150 [Candidatus Gracilibacteria bacterium]|jgi:hypothetical protein
MKKISLLLLTTLLFSACEPIPAGSVENDQESTEEVSQIEEINKVKSEFDGRYSLEHIESIIYDDQYWNGPLYDDTQRKRLTNEQLAELPISTNYFFSPDLQSIVFSENYSNIWQHYKVETKETTDLISFYEDSFVTPFGYSPDGKYIGFATFNYSEDYPLETKLFILKLENGEVTHKIKEDLAIGYDPTCDQCPHMIIDWKDEINVEYPSKEITQYLWNGLGLTHLSLDSIRLLFPEEIQTYQLAN